MCHRFICRFFEFIFDIYKINFEYDLPDEPYEDFQFVYEGLRNNMISDQEDISVNVTRKTYKLIVSTKQLIKREDGLDSLIKLSIIIVRLLDKHFWGKNIQISNSYLKTGYEAWKRQQSEPPQVSNRHRSLSEFRSRWEPKFLMVNHSICLAPPVHRVKAQYDYSNIAIEVLNDGKEIYRKDDCFIKEIIGGYQIDPPEIKIEKPLGKLTYRLVCGSEIIYDSKEKLHRDYIVFNEEGKEISNNTDFEGTAYICYKHGELELQNIRDKEFYCIGYKLIRSGDFIRIGNDVFNFSSMLKPGILGLLHKNCFLSKSDEDMNLNVYKEVEMLSFEADNISDKFEIVINSRPHKLSEMNHKVMVGESLTRYIVDFNLKESGIYTVEVNQIVAGGKRNQIFKEIFAYDPELNYQKETLDDERYRVTIRSGILKEEIDMELSVNDFEIDFINFDYLGEDYNYFLPFDFGFYKIDDGNWNKESDELWIDNVLLESVMLVLNSKYNGMSIYSESGILMEDDIIVRDKGICKSISIGFLNSYNNGNRYVSLVFTQDGIVKHVMRCYNNCVIDEERTEILSLDNPKRIMVTPVFHGKNPVFFEVFNEVGEKIYKSGILESGHIETLEDFNSFEVYSIKFYEKTKGLILLKNPIIYQINKTFYAKEDYIGRVFKIDAIYFHQFGRDSYIEKVFYFNKAYIRITEVLDDEYFGGEIFIDDANGPRYLYCINPVEIQLCSDVVDDTIDVYITNNGDGLLFHKGKILNSLVHQSAPDIFLYTLNMKGAVE